MVLQPPQDGHRYTSPAVFFTITVTSKSLEGAVREFALGRESLQFVHILRAQLLSLVSKHWVIRPYSAGIFDVVCPATLVSLSACSACRPQPELLQDRPRMLLLCLLPVAQDSQSQEMHLTLQHQQCEWKPYS